MSESASAASVDRLAFLNDRWVGWYLALAYVAVGLWFVHTDYALNDEGLLTHYWASWARQDFWPVLFFQKVKPVLATLYAPVSAGGAHATMAAHVVIAALAIPMIGSVARSLGHPAPVVASLIVASSPIFFFGGASGVSNIDGVVGVTAVLWLLACRRSPFLAGAIAGLLPWVRFELAIFVLLLAAEAVRSKEDRSLLAGLVLFPLFYVVGGAIYHSDLLWMLHYPASAPFDPSNPIYGNQLIGLRFFLEPALAVTPVAAFVVAIAPGRLPRLERLALVYFAAAVFALHVLPIFKIGNFGASPRYSIHVLPAYALLVSRVFGSWWYERRPTLAGSMFVVGLVLWMATRQPAAWLSVAIPLTYVAILAATWANAPTVAMGLVCALLAAGPILPLRVEIGRALTAPYLDPMVTWLRAHRREAEVPIYTNAHLLAPYLAAQGDATSERVTFMAGEDLTRELFLLTNPHNGQQERLYRLGRAEVYGKTMVAPIDPNAIPPGALFLLRVESRLPLLLPDATWQGRSDVIEESPLHRIVRLKPPPTSDPNSPPRG